MSPNGIKLHLEPVKGVECTRITVAKNPGVAIEAIVSVLLEKNELIKTNETKTLKKYWVKGNVVSDIALILEELRASRMLELARRKKCNYEPGNA